LRVKNLQDGCISVSDVLRIDEEVEKKYSRTRLRGGEVLLSLVGSVGEVAVVHPSLSGWNVARAIAVIRVAEGVSSEWIKLCLSTELAQLHMRIRQTDTVQATLNLRDVRRLPIVIPPARDREAIVSIIGALDDKIAVNDRVAFRCDELRRLLHWKFVSSSPHQVVERPLSSLADFVNGRAFTKGATGTGRMVVRIAEMNSGPGASTVYTDLAVPDRHLARSGDVLFAWSGSLTVMRWFRPDAIINQHIFKVIPRSGLPIWLAFEATSSALEIFRGIAADKTTTMGHIQRHHLDEPVSVPLDAVVPSLDTKLGPLWDRALAAEQESLILAGLRDILLPRLVSGELRVRDAEKIMEEAL
jgi:type I restriction enzyme S subunit